MKIAFVSQTVDAVVPPIQNSIGIWTYQVARRLAPAHDVTVYAKWSKSLPRPKEYEQIRFHFVQAVPGKVLDRTKALQRFSHPKRPPFAALWHGFEYCLQVAYHIRRQKFDVVHVHNFTQFIPIIRALNPNVKIVLHMQAEWLTQLDYAMIERRVKQTDLVIGCSNYITNKIRQRFPQFAHKCHTVFNGVDIEHFDKTDESTHTQNGREKQLLFVGRLSPEKGIHDLLDSFPKVVAQYPNVRLNLVGPIGELPRELIVGLSDEKTVTDLDVFYNGKSYHDHLRERITPAIADRVNFTGLIPHAEVTKHYRNADILVNPSLSESFGMSLTEAMVSRVPVVATRVGGMTDIVKEQETGLLVESANPDALADAIVRLLADDSLRQAMGRAGYQRAIERYSWDHVAASTLEQYQSIV